MAEVNYASPSSLLPNVQGQAQLPAFLQGMQYNTQMRDYDKSAALSQLMSQLALQRQSEDQVMGAPMRQSERLANMATNQATAATIGDLKRGTADEAFARGGVARATMQSDIATKLAQNASTQGEAGVKQLKDSLKYIQIVGQLQGPQAAAQAEQLGQQFKLPREIIQAAMADPSKIKGILLEANDQLQSTLVSDTNKVGLENYGRMQVQQLSNQQSDLNNRRTTAAMSARADAGGSKMSTDQLISMLERQVLTLQAEGKPIPPQTIDALNRLRQQRIDERTASAQQGQGGISNLTNTPPPPRVQAPAMPGGTQPTLPDMTPAKQDWFRRAKERNPGLSDAAIIKEGQRLGKL